MIRNVIINHKSKQKLFKLIHQLNANHKIKRLYIVFQSLYQQLKKSHKQCSINKITFIIFSLISLRDNFLFYLQIKLSFNIYNTITQNRVDHQTKIVFYTIHYTNTSCLLFSINIISSKLQIIPYHTCLLLFDTRIFSSIKYIQIIISFKKIMSQKPKRDIKRKKFIDEDDDFEDTLNKPKKKVKKEEVYEVKEIKSQSKVRKSQKEKPKPSKKNESQDNNQIQEKVSKKNSTQLRKKSQDSISSQLQLDTTTNYQVYQDIANYLRIDSINCTNVTCTGHPTSCASIADIFAILFSHEVGLRFNPHDHSYFGNDRFILSKGHAAPILYSAFSRVGLITREQLMTLRLKGSIIEGHPVPKIPFVDVATGSLGQGLSNACGIAYSSKYYDKINNRIFCLMGDGEVAEGSVIQAANFASYYHLNNLIAIIDVNRLGQSQSTMFQHHLKEFQNRWKSCGWKTIVIDGHSFPEIIAGLRRARAEQNRPVVIIAKNFKGKGLGEDIENQLDWHGKALGQVKGNQVISKIQATIVNKDIELKITEPEKVDIDLNQKHITIVPNYANNSVISTRKAYGNGLLKAHESNPNVIGLDGDTKNSTFSITLMNKYKQAYVECFIAEQNMVGVGIGFSTRNKIPFCSTFGAFFSRAADQIRIGGISGSNLKLVGSHSGCSIGEDGPSQMALEDLAFFRTIPNGIVLYPSDGVSTQKCVELAGNYRGMAYIRTARPDVKILYPNDEVFQLGGSKVLRQSETDQILLVSAGPTLHEALIAHQTLKQLNVNTRVIDLYSIKPVDKNGLIENAKNSNNVILTIEQHYPEGGIHQCVISAVINNNINVHRLSVERVPGSAKPAEQLHIHGLDAASIVGKVKHILGVQA